MTSNLSCFIVSHNYDGLTIQVAPTPLLNSGGG